jgi:hypothetical protein
MTHPIAQNHPLRRLFRGLTEHTFHADLGIADTRLVDYLSDLLARFVRSEGVWTGRDEAGRRLTNLAGLLADAVAAPDDERRQVCFRRAGDVALFWTGVFPEALGNPRASDASDSLLDFQSQGKRSYYLASTYGEPDDGPLLRKLSVEFELCAFGLSRVRKEWERLEPPVRGSDRPFLLA